METIIFSLESIYEYMNDFDDLNNRKFIIRLFAKRTSFEIHMIPMVIKNSNGVFSLSKEAIDYITDKHPKFFEETGVSIEPRPIQTYTDQDLANGVNDFRVYGRDDFRFHHALIDTISKLGLERASSTDCPLSIVKIPANYTDYIKIFQNYKGREWVEFDYDSAVQNIILESTSSDEKLIRFEEIAFVKIILPLFYDHFSPPACDHFSPQACDHFFWDETF